MKDAYALIAELWCCPSEADAGREAIKKNAKDVIQRLETVDEEAALLLSRFLGEEEIAEEDYIELFELDPQCALYLGSHTFEEPQTCATAGVSDRNGYMIELVAIYNHFGQKPNGSELPDYLPLMVDFLSLTVDSNDDPVRSKYVHEYILPHLPAMQSKLKDMETPYLYLLEALGNVILIDQEELPLPLSMQPE